MGRNIPAGEAGFCGEKGIETESQYRFRGAQKKPSGKGVGRVLHPLIKEIYPVSAALTYKGGRGNGVISLFEP